MDIKKLILAILDKKGEVRSSDVIKKTGFSRAYINRFLQELRDEGKIVLLGKANSARYVLATEKAFRQAKQQITRIHLILTNTNLAEDQVLSDIKKQTGIFSGTSENVSHIADYAFTEMLNNAIEHSRSERIDVTMEKDKDHIRFTVDDKGIGIFNNIMQKKYLHNVMEAIQDLLKGKQTTVPEAHSGEGIFFTSKCADIFTIKSSYKKLIYNNLLEDVFIKDIKQAIGTKIAFSISLESPKSLSDIFAEYTDSDSFEFNTTKVKVKLHLMETDYISRSQARRILSGLEKFQTIVLNFHGVSTIGQGFADEVFRVWKKRYPEKIIHVENTNENIDFMIKRAYAGV